MRGGVGRCHERAKADFRMFDVDSSKGSSDVIIGTCQDAWYNKKSDYFYSD